MIRTFLGALQFLTALPIRTSTAPPGRCAAWFPAVGAMLGYLGGSVYLIASLSFSRPMAGLFTVLFWVVATGALHEDGLADAADAFRAGRSPSRILEILKDSRIGSYGGLAIVFSVLLRWQSVARLSSSDLPALVAAQALPRVAIVLLAYFSRPAGTGLGSLFIKDLSFWSTIIAAACALTVFAVYPIPFALLLLGANAILVSILRRSFYKHLGGINGDCLGAASQLTEILTLLLLVCPLSPSSVTQSQS